MSDYFRMQPLPYQNTLTTTPPDLEMTGFPDLSVSLAPSSQCIVSRSSDTGVKHHMQTIAIGRLYDQGHHCKSKVSAARVQGAADEMSPGPSIARAGESSLKYAQGLALHRSPWCSRTGAHPPLQTPLPNSLQIGGGPTRVTLHPSSPIGSTTTPPASPAVLPHDSFAIAATLAENQLSSAPAAHISVHPSPVPGSVVQRPNRPQQNKRNRLAGLLRDYLQTNPEPIIGSPNNPFSSADELGIRGLSIFSAFFEHLDMETFTCTFCGSVQLNMEDALAHQRIFLQYCAL